MHVGLASRERKLARCERFTEFTNNKLKQTFDDDVQLVRKWRRINNTGTGANNSSSANTV